MPHISIKMLKGRTDEQKQKAAEALKKTLVETLGCSESHTSVSVEDYTAEEWQGIYLEEVVKKDMYVLVKPDYDPKSLMKK